MPGKRSRSRSPIREREATRQRTPPRKSSPTPDNNLRSSRSPEGRRPRKLPGRTSRLNAADQKAIEERQQRREEEQRSLAKAEAEKRGYDDLVRQHYNSVQQRGKQWRGTESKIKGLRSLNNWIKSSIIQRFSPSESFEPGARRDQRHNDSLDGLKVLDIGCGKGGDLQKWHAAPQKVELYVGLDPAEISIEQARGRYGEMVSRARRQQLGRRPLFKSQFSVKDCFGSWIGDVPIVKEIGIDGSVGPDGKANLARWGGGGFDVVSMMFCLHYAFESEEKARNMLRNVSGALKKGGRFIGVMPDSDAIAAKLADYNVKRGVVPVVAAQADDESDDEWDPEKPSEKPTEPVPVPATTTTPPPTTDPASSEGADSLEWGNEIYRVRIPNAERLPRDGVFRPPYGWIYNYFLEEAVEVPEFVVPWEALRALAVDYNLELEYRKPFDEVWRDGRDDATLGPLSERMGVVDRDGRFLVSPAEMEAASFYVAFSFYKV